MTAGSLGRDWDRSRLEVLVRPELGEPTLDVLREGPGASARSSWSVFRGVDGSRVPSLISDN